MGRFVVRDPDGNDGNVRPKCGGTGVLRNFATLSPSDSVPCSCINGGEDGSDDDDLPACHLV
jgi:hypothetical protein